MNAKIEYDKMTDVAYIDLCENASEDVRIHVIDVAEALGFKSPILARVDENGNLLGLIIEDFKSFKWEARKKYLALKVERFIDLIVCRVREVTKTSECGAKYHLPAHA